MDLEHGNFLKPTDAEGVWEFNMVERDIVYEVIPHYQRRRLHAKLAQVRGGAGGRAGVGGRGRAGVSEWVGTGLQH